MMDTKPLCDSMEDGMNESDGDEDGGVGRTKLSTSSVENNILEELTPFARIDERREERAHPSVNRHVVPQNYHQDNNSVMERRDRLSLHFNSSAIQSQSQPHQQQQRDFSQKNSFPIATVQQSQIQSQNQNQNHKQNPRRGYPFSQTNSDNNNGSNNSNGLNILRKPPNSMVVVGINEDELYSSSSPFHSATASPLYTGDSDYGLENEHDRDPLIKPPEKTGTFHKLLSSKLKIKQQSSSIVAKEEQGDPSTSGNGRYDAGEGGGERKCSVGIFLAAVSCIFFATSALIVKVSNLNPMELLSVRGMIQCILVSPIVISSKSSLIPAGSKSLLLVRAVLGSCALIMSFASITLIPLADAATVIFTSPIFVCVFACLCLGEVCGWFDMLMIALTLLGVLLVSKPSFDFINTGSWINIIGIACGLLASMLTALAFIVLRQLKHVHYSVTVFWFSTVLAFFGIVLTIATGFTLPNDFQTISECIGIGICGFFGQILLTKALQLEAAAPVAVARTLDIVIAFIFQLTFLHDIPDWKSYVGSALVVACVILTAFRRWYREAEEAAEDHDYKPPSPSSSSSSHMNSTK